MYIIIDTYAVSVEFRVVERRCKHGNKAYDTYCYLEEQNCVPDRPVIEKQNACARHNPIDFFNRITGEKLALTRVLQKYSRTLDEFDEKGNKIIKPDTPEKKRIRAVIWEIYNKINPREFEHLYNAFNYLKEIENRKGKHAGGIDELDIRYNIIINHRVIGTWEEKATKTVVSPKSFSTEKLTTMAFESIKSAMRHSIGSNHV